MKQNIIIRTRNSKKMGLLTNTDLKPRLLAVSANGYIPQVFYRHYPAYKNKQLNVSELARVCNMSRTTVYKYIEVLER